MNRLKFLFGVLPPLLFTSCLSLTNLQSGRTVGKDNIDLTPSVSLGQGLTAFKFQNTNDENPKGPVIGIYSQSGLRDKTDLIVRVDLQSYLGVGLKQQFLGTENSRFAGSIGLETGINVLQFLFANRNYYFTVPLHLSYDVSEKFTLCLAPRFLYQDYRLLSNGAGGTKGEHNAYARTGFSYGFLWGRNIKFGLEISNFGGPFFQPSQVSAGLVFNLTPGSKKNRH